MKIYKLSLDVDNYQTCFVSDTDFEDDFFEKFCTATTLNNEVGTVTFRYADEKEKMGDVINCWDFVGVLLNERTYTIFSKNNKIKAQYIKLQENFILLNNLMVINELDNDKTIFEYFEKDIIGVDKYHFKKINYPPLFQVSLPNGYVEIFYFVTDEFIKFVNDNNIKGFLFEEVWDSEKD